MGSLVEEELDGLVVEYSSMVKSIEVEERSIGEGHVNIVTLEGELLKVKLSSAGWVRRDGVVGIGRLMANFDRN
ncbi:hypothetical protein TRICI_003387 [Trichomonascus ciferrii]|uniref:Uncharacterized protein n=1 Tax=Trichomonascus ciferrii TaxID=44093 RepID=A0A642V907_9ASCO|nr:hypothetical protein TRICI_003387 [Trichomonascus ciferrii]